MKVRDIMSRNVVTIDEDADVQALVRLLSEKRISGCPVTDRKGKLVGVVSLYDLALRDGESAAQYWQGNPTLPRGYSLQDFSAQSTVQVSQIMTPAIFSISQDADLQQLCDFFLEGEIHRVLVTDEREELVGIVTGSDLIRVLRDRLKSVATV